MAASGAGGDAASSPSTLETLRTACKQLRTEGKSRLDLTFADGNVFSGETVVWRVSKDTHWSNDDEFSQDLCLRYGRMPDRSQVEAFLGTIAWCNLPYKAADPYLNIHLWHMDGPVDSDTNVGEILRTIVEHSDEEFVWEDNETLVCSGMTLTVTNRMHSRAACTASMILELMGSPRSELFEDFARKAL